MLANKLMSALSGGAEDKLYVDDVFSTYLYTGNGATQTINNGIDLAGKGGMVWEKARSVIQAHYLFDSARGVVNNLSTNDTAASQNFGIMQAFLSNGYRLNLGGDTSQRVSWTFRKAPKFFDMVTYTGDGLDQRSISHALGISAGIICVKRTDSAGPWQTYGRGYALSLNSTSGDSVANLTGGYPNAPTASTFRLNAWDGGLASVNASGGTYVAYLFAHDPSADGIIQCGSYTGNGSATGPIVNLGWEPQYLMVKNASGTGNWQIIDNMRGMAVGSVEATLQANLSAAESNADYVSPLATGFQITSTSSEVNASGSAYIFMAIRRPNKPPTSGAEVYNAIARTGTGAAATVTGVGFAPDLVVYEDRARYQNAWSNFTDRPRGAGLRLGSQSTEAEFRDGASVTGFGMDGAAVGISPAINSSGVNYINHFFKRAPGFFDVVCYTGTGVARTVPHSLGVAPELMIVKNRGGYAWSVWHKDVAAPNTLELNTTAAAAAYGDSFNSSTPTAMLLNIPDGGRAVNGSAETYVTYLFASLPGISKVGSYTGNGTTQTINCGFTTGARFILIKRTDSTGDWYVWDTARGIISANDPHLSLNTTAAEVTTDDSVDPDVSGFIVNQVAATNINVSGGQYIFLAIA